MRRRFSRRSGIAFDSQIKVLDRMGRILPDFLMSKANLEISNAEYSRPTPSAYIKLKQ